MKKMVILSLLLAAILSGCETEKSANRKLTDNEVGKLIIEWYKNTYKKTSFDEYILKVQELTTDEIWTRMNGQVYTATASRTDGNYDNVISKRLFFIKDNRAFNLCRNWKFEDFINWKIVILPDNAYTSDNFYDSGVNLKILLVSDLDKDGIPELCFSLLAGSGKIRSYIMCYIYELNDTYLVADTAFLIQPTIQTKLKKENDQDVFVSLVENNIETRIGKIFITETNHNKELKFKALK